MSAVNQAFSTGGGLATEVTLEQVRDAVQSIDTKTPTGGALTDAQLRATPVPVSGPLTDAQLRAAAVPVSGPLTDTQLRAAAVPISAASLPLPTGAATQTTLAAVKVDTTAIASSVGAINTKTPTVGQKAMAGSVPVVLASDQTAMPTSESPYTGGSSNTSTVTTTAVTITAPANAVGFLLQGSSANSDALRYRVGAVASSSVGMRLEPGQDSGYIPCGANISIASESGTQEYNFLWVVK